MMSVQYILTTITFHQEPLVLGEDESKGLLLDSSRTLGLLR